MTLLPHSYTVFYHQPALSPYNQKHRYPQWSSPSPLTASTKDDHYYNYDNRYLTIAMCLTGVHNNIILL